MAFSGGMTRPMLLSGRDPVYTAAAREAGVEGTMVARCTITTSGAVTGCRVLKSLPHMNEAVVSALQGRRYTPVMWEGKAVPVSYVFNIRLVLPK
jgi:TonB family protein